MADQFITKDSGKRVEYPTGCLRDTQEGKGRFDLLPAFALRRLAKLYERGAVKYGDNNWRQGMPMSRALSSLLRHACDYAEGERTEDHLAAVIFNAICLMHVEREVASGHFAAELADLPDRLVAVEG